MNRNNGTYEMSAPLATDCKLVAYDIPDSASYFGLSVLISLFLAYVDYGSLTVTTVPPYNDLIILLVCFCSECFLLPSRQQVSTDLDFGVTMGGNKEINKYNVF